MVNAGRILIVPKGIWSSLTSYEMLDLVTQDGVAYIARQASVGVQPKTDSQYTYWQPFGNAAEPDNETIVYDENNKYTVNLDGKMLVYDSTDGITVAIDGETIKFDEDEGYLYAEVKSNLADLLDVVLTTPANGQVLTYNAITGKWVNANPTGGMQAHLVITSEVGSTVTVTTPSGSIITATQVSGSTTQWECDTQEYGVHTIDAVLAGDDAQITVTVDTCKVYNIDDSHVHASITVTFPRGFTCRCQGQGENYYANSNPYTFSVHHLGEYTITATDGADTTYTETVTISSSAQSVSMFCPSVANAPTDDIQLWLMFGSILDKNYTTLSEVLADSTTLSALIADNNAVDYMVRSKSWASNKGLVPQMTSNTTPSGVVSASSSLNSTYAPFNPFNDSISAPWATSNNDKGWIQYEFPTAVCVRKVGANFYAGVGFEAQGDWELLGSNNGTDFTSIQNHIRNGNTSGGTIYTEITNDTNYKYYRLKANDFNYIHTSLSDVQLSFLQFYSAYGNGITEDSTAMSYIGLNNYCANTLLADSDWLNAICNSTYFESVLNAKVPVMTSNTTPSGVAVASSVYLDRENAQPWKAFDGIDAEGYGCATATNDVVGAYVGYQFTSPCKVYLVYLSNSTTSGSNTIKKFKLQDSIGDISSEFTVSKSADAYICENNSSANNTCKLVCTEGQSGATNINIYEIQFYGRQDV